MPRNKFACCLVNTASATMLLFVLAGCDQWRMFHHDPLHTGRSWVDTSSSTGAMLWQFPVPKRAISSSPAVITFDTIYIGTEISARTEGSATGSLLAIAFNGTLLWEFVTGGGVVAGPAVRT